MGGKTEGELGETLDSEQEKVSLNAAWAPKHGAHLKGGGWGKQKEIIENRRYVKRTLHHQEEEREDTTAGRGLDQTAKSSGTCLSGRKGIIAGKRLAYFPIT